MHAPVPGRSSASVVQRRLTVLALLLTGSLLLASLPPHQAAALSRAAPTPAAPAVAAADLPEGATAEWWRAVQADIGAAHDPLHEPPRLSGLSTDRPAWRAEGDQADAHFGWSVSTAGDVNGDGFADVIVGADEYGSGGAAFVYHGSASGLETSPAWSTESNQADADFGQSVSTAGDVNGDGFADVIVSAPRTHNGNEDPLLPLIDAGRIDTGSIFVYHGSASGLSENPAWRAEGDQAGAAFGVSVSTAGDVNGDGFDDVIVGADEYDDGESNEGAAFVYHGSADG